MNKQKQGFTLVELIVVITILAILGTIAIMAFSGYSKNARDSARLSDIGNMKKSLELWILQSGIYPAPSSGTGVTYSGSTVWTQGNFGDSVISTVGKLDKKPVDPLYNNEYTYSVTQSKKEYQIGAVLEKDMALNNPILPQTYAATTGEAYVSGTYNGILTTVGTSPVYIIAIPSILISDTTVTELKNIATNTLVYEGQSNLPSSYKVTGLTMTGTSFAFTPTVVWSGSSLTELNTQTGFQDMVSNLQNVYTNNSVFASLPEYTSIVTGDTTPSITTMSFVKELVQTNTSTELSNVSSTYVSYAVNGVCGTADGQALGNSSSITGSAACTVGTASTISGSGPWTWTCGGTNGGTTANCSAQKVVCNDGETVENGQCKDPYWSNVVYLSHFDNNYNDVLGNTGTISGVITLSSSSKIGSGALFLDGSHAGEGFTTNANSNIILGTNPFTLEFYLSMTNPGQYKHDYIIHYSDNVAVATAGSLGIHSWEHTYGDGNKLVINYSSSYSVLLNSQFVPTANQWYHIAIVRDASNNSYFFVDGILKAKGTGWTQNLTGNRLRFGGGDSNNLWGKMDEFRITKGAARYTGTTIGQTYFTPPVQAFSQQ